MTGRRGLSKRRDSRKIPGWRPVRFPFPFNVKGNLDLVIKFSRSRGGEGMDVWTGQGWLPRSKNRNERTAFKYSARRKGYSFIRDIWNNLIRTLWHLIFDSLKDIPSKKGTSNEVSLRNRHPTITTFLYLNNGSPLAEIRIEFEICSRGTTAFV